MLNSEWFGLALISFVVVALAAFIAQARIPARLKQLLLLALALRIVGSIARYEVLYRFYDGVGDAVGYFGRGKIYADALWRLDFSIFSSAEWFGDGWWGTQFVRYVSGIVLAVIGPTMRGEFIVFSLLSFAGLYLFAKAFQRAYPQVTYEDYARWLWLWPSLWFWPSSVGKEALVLLATGLVVFGYVGQADRMRWFPMVAGLALAFAIRPHVAGVMAVSLAIAHWLSLGKRWTPGHVLQGLVLLGLSLFVAQQALTGLGLGDADLEGLQEFVQYRSALSEQGGSAIEAPSLSVVSIPLALVNVLFRPFPWEVHHVMALLASLEVVVFWSLVWRRRQRVVQTVREWQANRLLRLAVPLTLFYVLMLGIVVGNLGIIARQRVLVLPFLLLWLEAVPASDPARVPAPVRARGLMARPGLAAGRARMSR